MIKYSDFDLTDYNSYRIGSRVKDALFPENIDEVEDAFRRYKDLVVLGGGNNIIISKSYYDSTFIFIRDNLSAHHAEGNIIRSEAGLDMAELSQFACENELSGLEIYYDIPGSVGGAVFMNAGNAELTISQLVDTVWAYNKVTKEIEVFNNEACLFGYRSSVFMSRNELVILKVNFQLKIDNSDAIRQKMLVNKTVRDSKQPKDYPNAGSVFKRPKGYFVGTMIEELGLKGYSIGGAQVSEKHAGFIVNKGLAKGEDVLMLIKYIQDKVYNAYSVKLELEQVII